MTTDAASVRSTEVATFAVKLKKIIINEQVIVNSTTRHFYDISYQSGKRKKIIY